MNDSRFKVRFATSVARAEIESWLRAHCGDRWSIRFLGADDHDSIFFRMVFEASFVRDRDCQTFRRALSRAADGGGIPIIASRHAFRAAEHHAATRHG